MSGFAGFTGSMTNDVEKTIREMTDKLRHRGPDSEGYYHDPDCTLGFRGLSIMDTNGASQPIINEDNTKVLVCNGIIYNFEQLREELIYAGHVFATKLDTEVILHGFEEWGEEVLHRLRGMFAFVIWDKPMKKLFGARDVFGVKPFYFYNGNEQFMFASEIKAFLPHPQFKKELFAERLPEYLCFEYIPTNETFFKNVYKLLGAHCFTWQGGQMKTRKYYDIEYNIDESKSLEEWEDLIEEEFSASVSVHKNAEVELGCFLSSGVDSSYTVKETSKDFKELKTFSVGYAEEKYSELSYAQNFAKEMGLQNISNKVSADEFFGYAGQIQYFMDEPLPNPSEVPLFFLSQNASKHVKLVLSGEGADELFGGYPSYLAASHYEKYSKIPHFLRNAAAATAKKLPALKGRNFLIHGAMSPNERYPRSNYVFHWTEREKFLKNCSKAIRPEEYTKQFFEKVSCFDEPTQFQYADMHTWMPFDILQKADRMSMANSVELRTPFLDQKMLELALQIPTKYKLKGSTTKLALRNAAARHLPKKTAYKTKLGFPVPLADWLRQDKFYTMVREKFMGEIASLFFKTDAILQLLDDHKQEKAANMKKIWSIYTFILWYEQFFILN